ncbi:MAG: hypothetical protein CW346_14065 [Bacillaceae bacterium]|nr:hypothetical protein [Bacillaceae bacterium]
MEKRDFRTPRHGTADAPFFCRIPRFHDFTAFFWPSRRPDLVPDPAFCKIPPIFYRTPGPLASIT